MKRAAHYESREEQAKAEIGVTAFSRPAALSIMLLFLATLVVVLLVDQISGGWLVWRTLENRGSLRQRLHGLETSLEETSRTNRAVRPLMERILAHAGVSGAANVYLGRDGWLFFEPDVAYVSGRGFLEPARHDVPSAAHIRDEPSRAEDPIAAIVDFKRQLAERGIKLVVVPTPVKPSLEPEMLWSGAQGPMQNRSFERFKRTLEERGVKIFDLATTLPPDRMMHRYLATDTHWRPETMEQAAARLAEFVNANVPLPQSLGVGYRRQELAIRGHGDLAGLLKSPQRREWEEVTIHPIARPNYQPWAAESDAAILWLGDSFSNIYSAEAMGWGGAAGFVEQFSYFLGRTCDALRRNDQGAFATRQMLADELASGRDRLAGKKLVIWQLAERELSQGDWKLIEMKLGQAPQRQMIVPPAGESWIISGTIAEQGAAPRPGNVAYRDHVLAVLLNDVTTPGGPVPGGQAIVYLRSMVDGKLTETASLQIGQRVRLRVRDWSEVSRQYEFIHRSDLPGTQWRTQPACWGEWVK